MSTLLRMTGISKSYAGLRALRGVSFDLARGEVHALVGENGAGKSTLVKTITGAVLPDRGTIEVEGGAFVPGDPAKSRALGIRAIYQQPALFPDLSVAENIALGLEKRRSWQRVRWANRRARARALLDRVGADIDPETEVRRLSMPEQQLVEIARAIGADARVLVMDEPTASLSGKEVERLFRVIRELRKRELAPENPLAQSRRPALIARLGKGLEGAGLDERLGAKKCARDEVNSAHMTVE